MLTTVWLWLLITNGLYVLLPVGGNGNFLWTTTALDSISMYILVLIPMMMHLCTRFEVLKLRDQVELVRVGQVEVLGYNYIY